MLRREVIAFIGGSVVAWPLAGRAQQQAMRVVGFLNGNAPGTYAPYVAAFRRGLGETGYVEGQNLAIEYRWAEGHYDRLPTLAADLIGRKVVVIAPPVAGGKENHLDDPDRLHRWVRPGRDGLGRQPRPAGRQPYRGQLPHL